MMHQHYIDEAPCVYKTVSNHSKQEYYGRNNVWFGCRESLRAIITPKMVCKLWIEIIVLVISFSSVDSLLSVNSWLRSQGWGESI